MSTEVTRAMQDLSMQGGRFDAQLSAAEPSAQGIERSSSWSQATPASARSRSLVLHPAASSRVLVWRSR